MLGTIVWIHKAHTKRPNDQRAKILAYAQGYIMVEMCGDHAILALPVQAIAGIEFDDDCTLYFQRHRKGSET